jgi:hypothetical protein
MAAPKAAALPLGYTPTMLRSIHKKKQLLIELKLKYIEK